ncbi:NAD-dependent epimerase/dehydratase family protein [Thermotoga caldifontis]|uniref:NAD-dependent epimerase/dehydratase family protein n=1 Tax=Thermotoga caldifontis TaxID=1508419 RepID=UPI00069418AB|nr:NAD-dependent epimerase/dehydratase family protein [Thermotoga caldifontis]
MIVVTGATGHLGNVLVRRLLQMNEKVRVLVAPSEDVKPIEGLNVEIFRADVRDSKAVERLCEGAQTVFHLAAVISIFGKKRLVYDVNVNGTKNIVEACLKNSTRLVYVSSVHAFAELSKGSLIDESVPIDPSRVTGCYAKSKAIATNLVLDAAKRGLDAVVVCPTGIIGPYDWRVSEMGNLFLLHLKGRLKVAVEGGFDFVDVRDVVEALVLAWKKAKSGEIFIVGGTHVTVKALIQMLQKIEPKRSVKIFLPIWLAYVVSAFTSLGHLFGRKVIFTPYAVYTLSRNYVYSHTKASKELGYTPRPIEDSLKDTIEWLKSSSSTQSKTIPPWKETTFLFLLQTLSR